MIDIAIIGAGGRMGNALVRCVSRSKDLQLVAAIDQKGHPGIGQDAGSLAGIGSASVTITSDLHAVADADVVIDFTLPSATAANVAVCQKLGRAMVIGTTGIGDAEKAILQTAAAIIPIVWAPNMSLGVNLLFTLVKKAAASLGLAYGVDIDETHHIHKKDAPSGTALRLGEKVAEGRGRDFKADMTFIPEDCKDKFTADRIVMRSHRIGEVVGDHTVSFRNDGETIEFTHHAFSREAFAMGALQAARWVLKRPPALYDMQDVLGLKNA